MDPTNGPADSSKDQRGVEFLRGVLPGLTKDLNVGTTKYPYDSFWPGDNCTYSFADQSDSEYRHLVVGHSQVRGKWNVKVNREDLQYNMDWISYSGGKARFLAKVIIRFLKSNPTMKLRISAIIWQNSVSDTSLEDMKNIVQDIQAVVEQYPQHKVAYPTLQFVPDQEQYFGRIGEFNIYLRELNLQNGMSPYNLHKTTMISKKGKGMRVSQSAWKEFNNNKGKGYHIDPKKWEGYVKIIKTYHLTGFMDHKGSRNSTAPRLSVELHECPNQKGMVHPASFDVRNTLNNIKSRKRNRYGKVLVEDDLRLQQDNRFMEEHVNKLKEVKQMDQECTATKSLLVESRKVYFDLEAKWTKQGEKLSKEIEEKEALLMRQQKSVDKRLEEFREKQVKLDLNIAELDLQIGQIEKDKKDLNKLQEEIKKKKKEKEKEKEKEKGKKKHTKKPE